VVASPTEASLITTNPQQVQAMQQGSVDVQGAGPSGGPGGTIDLGNRLYPGSA